MSFNHKESLIFNKKVSVKEFWYTDAPVSGDQRGFGDMVQLGV